MENKKLLFVCKQSTLKESKIIRSKCKDFGFVFDPQNIEVVKMSKSMYGYFYVKKDK